MAAAMKRRAGRPMNRKQHDARKVLIVVAVLWGLVFAGLIVHHEKCVRLASAGACHILRQGGDQ
jgi:hypothetical protein